MNNNIIILKDAKNTGELINNINFLKESIKNLDNKNEEIIREFYDNYISQILAGGIRGEHHYLNVLLLWINTTTYCADDVINYFSEWVSNPNKRELQTQTIYNWYRDCEYNNYKRGMSKIKEAVFTSHRVDNFISRFNDDFSWYLYGARETTNRIVKKSPLSLAEFYDGLPPQMQIGIKL